MENDILRLLKEDETLNYLWSLATNKRPTKTQIRQVDMDLAIIKMKDVMKLRLPVVARFFNGLILLYWYKMKIIYEDLHLITIKSSNMNIQKKRLFKSIPLKPIELNVKHAEMIVEDLTNKSENVTGNTEQDEEIMEPSVCGSLDAFDMDNISLSNIEIARNSILSEGDVTQIKINHDKRRKVVVDKEIEHDLRHFEKRIQNVKEILKKENNQQQGNISGFCVPREVLNFLKEQTLCGNSSIELGRNTLVESNYYENGAPEYDL